jgi:hypothetical protein
LHASTVLRSNSSIEIAESAASSSGVDKIQSLLQTALSEYLERNRF